MTATRPPRRALDGWLVIDKPLGLGSTAAVARVRWALRALKAGHAGTLDPLATGVLAVALGEATKTVPHAMGGLKTYRFTVRWGEVTATDDREGPVIATSAERPTVPQIAAALPGFRGQIAQVPPQFSAVKVAGARAYAVARGGGAVELAARPLWVEDLSLIDTPDADHAQFELTCGKGGYVRAIARDLGAVLGCGAHVTALRRTRAGPFCLDHAISFEMLDQIGDDAPALARLLPVATGLDDIPALAVTDSDAALLRQGRAVPVTTPAPPDGTVAWASLDGLPVAICSHFQGLWRPDRVFNLTAQ